MHRALKAVAGWWLARRLPANLNSGEVYAFISKDGGYQIAKVLKADRPIVHVRLYKERFPTVPAQVDTRTLIRKHTRPRWVWDGTLTFVSPQFRLVGPS
jgi:hypothetical protein